MHVGNRPKYHGTGMLYGDSNRDVIVPCFVKFICKSNGQIDCIALQNDSEKLRTKSNAKKICLKCSSECGITVDEPYSSR